VACNVTYARWTTYIVLSQLPGLPNFVQVRGACAAWANGDDDRGTGPCSHIACRVMGPSHSCSPKPSCDVSFRENHWRGLADHHTVAFSNAVTHADQANDLHHELGHHRRLRLYIRRRARHRWLNQAPGLCSSDARIPASRVIATAKTRRAALAVAGNYLGSLIVGSRPRWLRTAIKCWPL
jgi:hypothetical protein